MPQSRALSEQTRNSLSGLDGIRPLYLLPKDDLADELLIPCFRKAASVRCMVGFFSSLALVDLAPGLATFIRESTGQFRLIVSPYLRAADAAAIEKGIRSGDETALVDALEPLVVTEELIEVHSLKCLTYLLRVGRVDLRIAIMRNALFHPKVWLFESGVEVIVAHGSSNLTPSGLARNFEQVTVSKSWADPTQQYIVDKLKFQFERLWDNLEDDTLVVPVPDAIRRQLLQTYQDADPPTEGAYRALYKRAMTEGKRPSEPLDDVRAQVRSEFSIPPGLQYEDGPFAHQGEAVRKWCEAGFRGVLEMATGSGKTVVAMIATHRLHRHKKPLLVVVAAPYVPLIEQWCGEIEAFGITCLYGRFSKPQ